MATVPDDPLHFQTGSPVVQFGAPSNPHMSLEYNDEVLVSDLVNHNSPGHSRMMLKFFQIVLGRRQSLAAGEGWSTWKFQDTRSNRCCSW